MGTQLKYFPRSIRLSVTILETRHKLSYFKTKEIIPHHFQKDLDNKDWAGGDYNSAYVSMLEEHACVYENLINKTESIVN